MTWKYLKKINETCTVLDHRLCPEVRAMLAAMASRMPSGGIEARYAQVVGAVLDTLQLEGFDSHTQDSAMGRARAEDKLCEYPLHPKVQEFFYKFVGQYGHSSIQELTGQPAVYIEGVSPFTAYLSFDNPLVSGQEFSTRAVRRKDWPMCREAMVLRRGPYVYSVGEEKPVGRTPDRHEPHSDLRELHEAWMEIFEAEVEEWREEFSRPCEECEGTGEGHPCAAAQADGFPSSDCYVCEGTGKKYPNLDSEPFRPALDRARWALPSTIATGFAHSANVRVMGRVIQDGEAFSAKACPSCGGRVAVSQDNLICAVCGGSGREPSRVWSDIRGAYEGALPGMRGMWGREAVATSKHHLPGHLQVEFVPPSLEVRIDTSWDARTLHQKAEVLPRRESRGYLDPAWNQLVQVGIRFQCSWAVARDWHRHRTAYPWKLGIVSASRRLWRLHKSYEPISKASLRKKAGAGTPRFRTLMCESSDLFYKFRSEGDMEKAMLCLPLGTLVSMETTMGLRDAVYMLELRYGSPGSNFEYRAQAGEALRQLEVALGPELSETLRIKGPDKNAT